MKDDKIRNVWDMDVFKLAHKLTLEIYTITKKFPKVEMYSSASQMRRAASSIPMNLAEGAARGSRGEYRRYACIAKGSVGEMIYQLVLCRDLGYIDAKRCRTLTDNYDRVGKMLTRLAQSLARKSN